jgi:hypothetical protein
LEKTGKEINKRQTGPLGYENLVGMFL